MQNMFEEMSAALKINEKKKSKKKKKRKKKEKSNSCQKLHLVFNKFQPLHKKNPSYSY